MKFCGQKCAAVAPMCELTLAGARLPNLRYLEVDRGRPAIMALSGALNVRINFYKCRAKMMAARTLVVATFIFSKISPDNTHRQLYNCTHHLTTTRHLVLNSLATSLVTDDSQSQQERAPFFSFFFSYFLHCSCIAHYSPEVSPDPRHPGCEHLLVAQALSEREHSRQRHHGCKSFTRLY